MTSDSVIDNFRHGTPAIGENRCSASQGFDEYQSKRFGPIKRGQQGTGVSQEIIFFGIGDLAHPFNQWVIQERLDALFKVIAIHRINLGGNAQRNPGARCDGDRLVRAFLRRNAPEERQILALLGWKV